MTMDAAIWRVYRSLGETYTDALEDERIAALLAEFVPEVIPRLSAGSGIRDGAGNESYNLEEVIQKIQNVKKDRQTLAHLISLPAVAQRSEEWYNLRKERLTASDASKALVMNRERDRLVRSKAFPDQAPFIDTPPTRWGKVFEPMALRIYRARNAQVVVHDFGLIPHPTLSCFGASPDGITATGIMVEIKCPYSREIKPGYIPDYYEIQMQGQMAVCNLSTCDYIECKLIRHDNEAQFAAAARRCKYPEDYGVVILDDKENATDYSPANLTAMQCIEWKNNRSLSWMWTLGLIQVQRVIFDPSRWDAMVPMFEQFWADVVALRAAGPAAATMTTRSVGAKDKAKKVVEFIDSDDD